MAWNIVCINLIHIAKCSYTAKLFKKSGRLLKKGKFPFLYVPVKIANKDTIQSNYLSHDSLKMQNNLWGIRNIEKVSNELRKNGFLKENIINMLVNNFSVIYIKVSNYMKLRYQILFFN